MLRIYFTGEDLARVRIASGPDPLWELVLALQMLKSLPGDPLFSSWRREVATALRDGVPGPTLRLLGALTPNVGYFPDFLNPIEATRGLHHGLEAVRCTRSRVLRRDMCRLADSRPLPACANAVAQADSTTLVKLTEGMLACHAALVAPYRHSIETAIRRDRTSKVDAMASQGVEGLLRSLRPHAAWSPGELQVSTHRDQEIELDGRGLLLIPSYFCVNGPMTMFDPALTPVLIYPVGRQPDTLPIRRRPKPEALSALLGATRATALEAIGANSRTTSELAREVGISAGSASEHASVLRRSGLVASNRDRNRVHHRISTLGLALLEHHQIGPW